MSHYHTETAIAVLHANYEDALQMIFLLVIRITHSRSLEDRLYAIKGTASSSYSRTSLFSSNNANVNLDQDNSLKDVTNETTFNNELLHLNSQRLTVSYSISNGSISHAKEGFVVAGGQCKWNPLIQLSHPNGLFFDMFGTLYVADEKNTRVLRWTRGAKLGIQIVDGNPLGSEVNQLCGPKGLSFDRHNTLYVVDWYINRVQRLSIEYTRE
ncbi:unnamed protein product [Rotaria socialis]|uniref:Uncharacterized protein n=1 Tax=Rotaria socialis TaxID=392032 RepID=A0A819AQ88_9BILA|nr:unnamed protein product [Rotaria socialis]